ncbi:hypothetical protein Gotur_032361 [Gossypium turneri]
MAGYLAHWHESLDDPDTKIIRPQQRVVDSPSSPPEESLCLIMTMKMMKGEH